MHTNSINSIVMHTFTFHPTSNYLSCNRTKSLLKSKTERKTEGTVRAIATKPKLNKFLFFYNIFIHKQIFT